MTKAASSLLAEAHEACRAAQEQHGEEEPDDLRIAKRIFGQIHGRIIGGSVLSPGVRR